MNVASPLSQIRFPEKLQFLFQPARYKVAYGGRGSSKSWSFARALLLLGIQRPLKVLCARELQNSIEESVHSLLKQQIVELGLEGYYIVEKKHIYGPGGTVFFFEGIARNINRIRSIEGIDICWVEEAHKVSHQSWAVLIPTIRKTGSEIWITFNPELEDDPTYQRFIKSKPIDSIVVPVNWQDNPWFPEVLRREMEDLKARDYDEYLHVYEGHCLVNLKGAVFAKELRRAREENRITQVPYDRGTPVDLYFDLGRRDMTSAWGMQRVAMQRRVLFFYEDNGEHISYHLKELDKLPYIYDTFYLPHDAATKTVGAKYTVEQQVRDGGKRKVRIIKAPRRKFDGINASRTIFDTLWFDEQKCSAGLLHLSRYRYDVSEGGVYSPDPVHDEHSHAADALQTMALSLRPPKEKPKDFEWGGKEHLFSQGWLR